jgi:hypothetical protein
LGFYVKTEDHGLLPVTNMLDIDGEDTKDVRLAMMVVAIRADGLFEWFEVRPGDVQRLPRTVFN